MSKKKKPPRLHGASTLEEAATWLTYWSGEHWSKGAVLSRMFAEWEPDGSGERLLLPRTLRVVMPAGTVLVNPFNGESSKLSRSTMMVVGGAALEVLLRDLHEHDEAVPQALFDEGGKGRWRTEAVIKPDALRLTGEQIDALLPGFDALLRVMDRGEFLERAGIVMNGDAPFVRSKAGQKTGTELNERWKTQAQTRAREIIVEEAAKDRYPSQQAIADRIAREFRDQGITGPSQKPLSGETIKRHALKGISSESNRLRSAAEGRGK